MSFRGEWNSIKAEVEQDRAKLNLAGLAPEYDSNGKEIPGPGPDFGAVVITPALLRKKAKEADTTRANLKKADNSAVDAIKKATSGLKGFQCQKGIRTFEERWEKQVDHLDRLIENGVAGGLNSAAAEMDLQDMNQGTKFKSKN